MMPIYANVQLSVDVTGHGWLLAVQVDTESCCCRTSKDCCLYLTAQGNKWLGSNGANHDLLQPSFTVIEDVVFSLQATY